MIRPNFPAWLAYFLNGPRIPLTGAGAVGKHLAMQKFNLFHRLLLLIPFVRRRQILLERAIINIQNEYSHSREVIEEGLEDDAHWNSPETRRFCYPEEGWEAFPFASSDHLGTYIEDNEEPYEYPDKEAAWTTDYTKPISEHPSWNNELFNQALHNTQFSEEQLASMFELAIKHKPQDREMESR